MSSCPSARELEAHALGAARNQTLDDHVSCCSSCRERIEEIRENQDFLNEAVPALIAAFAATDDVPTAPIANAVVETGAMTKPPVPGMVRGYELFEEIARGGQGIVYRAVQTATKRPAAVKMLLGGAFASERQKQRFDREVEIAARLRHPNIVSVFESGETASGRPYVAMELVSGLPLDVYVDEKLGHRSEASSAAPRELRARVDAIMRLFSAVVAGVSHAHTNGVIHRDLKPSNIIVDADGNPRLLDFGLARPADVGTGVTATIEFAGTPAFASPEQFGGDPMAINARSDVYALGLILYLMLTCKHPYPCTGAISDVIHHTTTTEPTPPSRHVPRLPTDVETIVLKCLAKDPARRYPSASALAADIDDYLAGRPISARRDNAMYVLRRLAMRHRIPAIAAALALATIVVAMISLALLASDLDRSQRRTEAALSDSTVQRARLMAATGGVDRAERTLWTEAIRAGLRTDDSLCVDGTPPQVRSAWSLVELYTRIPRVFRTQLESSGARVGINPEERIVWCVDATGSRKTWSLDGHLLATTQPAIEPERALYCQVIGNGQLAAVQSRDSLIIRDIDAGVTLAGPVPWPMQRGMLDFSADESLLLFVDLPQRQTLQVCDSTTLTKIAEFGPPVFSACFQRRPEGLFLCTGTVGGKDPSIIVRQAPDWHIVRSLPLPASYGNHPGNEVRNVRLSPDGLYVLATSFAATALLENRNGIATVTGEHVDRSTVNCAEFDERGSTVATGCIDGTINVLHVPDLSPVVTYPNVAPTTGITTRADIGMVAVVDSLAQISAYETKDRPWLERISASDVTKEALAVAPDGTIAWGDDYGDLSIRTSGASDHAVMLRAHEGPITSVAFSPDGARILTAGLDGAVRLWSSDGSPLGTIAERLPGLWSARFCPDGHAIAAGGLGGLVRIWREGSAEPAFTIDTHSRRMPMLAFSPDGKSLATGASFGEARIWDVDSGAERLRLPHPSESIRAVAFSPNGAVVVTGADDRAVRVFDASTGEQLRVIEGLPWAVFDLKYHPGGKIIFAIGRGGEVAVLDPFAGVEVAKLPVHRDIAFSIVVSPDGHRLYTCGQDPWIGIIDLDRLRSYVRGNEAFWRAECVSTPGATPDATQSR